MKTTFDAAALGQLFLVARTFNKFTAEPVCDDLHRKLYDLYEWGPTSMNSQPGRLVFVCSAEAKEKLKSALMPNNVEKTMAAPVVVIVALDTAFYEHMPTQFAANPGARDKFANNAVLISDTAARNSSLQGAYLIMAARALGLAAGAMSGFNPAMVNEALFPDGRWKANSQINLGWGDASGNRPRGPRLAFEEAVVVA